MSQQSPMIDLLPQLAGKAPNANGRVTIVVAISDISITSYDVIFSCLPRHHHRQCCCCGASAVERLVQPQLALH